MFGDTNIVIINELSNTLAFFISIIFHLRNLSHNQSKTPLVNFLLQLDTLRSEFTDTHRNDSKMNSKNLQKALDYFGINNNGSDYKLGAIQLFEKATEAFIWFKSVVASME